ncbi:DDE-type integrase/transposase/recombinase [Massilia sp. B-10]|nr:DDE-type integrase/transposase/recombinase [Massilia sp. B-10]UUZ52249.1 DDE-type integrase/transposase/recombinase [Massilia sp. H-1]
MKQQLKSNEPIAINAASPHPVTVRTRHASRSSRFRLQSKHIIIAKEDEPGFVQIDTQHLPLMLDESTRRYLFLAIDSATRWAFVHIYGDNSAKSAVDFLRRLELASPMKISKIQTDNAEQSTCGFVGKDNKHSAKHAFDLACARMDVEHHRIAKHQWQKNGKVERFSRRISQLLELTRLESRTDLETMLLSYLDLYNHHIAQCAIGSKTPIQLIKEWHSKRPDLFVKRADARTELDK